MADEKTSFEELEQRFLGTIVDDLYVALSKEDTEEILDDILIEALPWFKFPKKKNLMDFDRENRCFNCELDELEKLILVKYMTMVWVQRQLYVIDLTKQRFSGDDYSFTSQASHLRQLITLKQETEREGYHLQSDYYRRDYDEDKGYYKSSLGMIMGGED